MPAQNDGKAALEALATAVSATTGLNIVLGTQKDSSLSWRGFSVHPLQILENPQQHAALEASRGKEGDARTDAEQEALSRFFFFQSTPPLPIGPIAANARLPPETLLSDARSLLTKVSHELSNGPPSNDRLKVLKAALRVAHGKMNTCFGFFRPDTNVPLLEEPQLTHLDGALTEIRDATSGDDLKAIIRDRLEPARRDLKQAIDGNARVQMFYNIEPFLLFRLLVNFQIESDQEISVSDRQRASGQLTASLNNGRGWLITWIKRKLCELDETITRVGGGDAFFHLKGGRALAYLLGKPEDGENDWDTSIVINPNLPSVRWYDCFNKVHDAVLELLQQFKRDFLVLLQEHARQLEASLQQPQPQNPNGVDEDVELDAALEEEDPPILGDDEEIPLPGIAPKYVKSCKAELIDIGIPRRDTVEALEQWLHTRDDLIKNENTEEIPIPGFLYYVDEYVMMVREALAGRSPSLSKTPKRIRRLWDILSLDSPDFDARIKELRSHIPATLGNKPLEILTGQGNKQISIVLTVILEQFNKAYRLSESQGLASVFGQHFLSVSQQVPIYPQDLQQAIAGDNQFRQETHGLLLKWIAIAARVSADFEAHFKMRAADLGFAAYDGASGAEAQKKAAQRRNWIISFVQAIYSNALLLNQKEEFEIQLAAAGSFASYLHADYANLPEERRKAFDPVVSIDLKFYTLNPAADPKTVLELMVLPGLNENLSTNFAAQATVKDAEVFISLPAEIEWTPAPNGPQFKYKPVVVKISVVRNEGWPGISYIWGDPVLSLRDLIGEYAQTTATAGEYEARERFRNSATALQELLTDFTSASLRPRPPFPAANGLSTK
ncbi:hypothetical protein [Archangium violaceum]|uniref:Uncharacterized protein n=1 Tax=Archangium violaceum Cb vi76 TaxID=1406225 RepID=A0A084SJM8_9BACT|nr:hypothetical protein [Archangium violaceum]KFA88663.1 hypothetical protein Q664_39265 [Archangium violaceum Cb vi76]